jgi:Spy/CpxP family protein refolding chaperone
MRTQSLIILASMLALFSTAMAVNPVDSITPQDIQKAVEQFAEGNLTKEGLKKQAEEHFNQNLNLTPEQLQQMAQEEFKKQLTQKVQPGFESVFTLATILVIFYFIRRKG